MKINTMEDLKIVVYSKWKELSNIAPEYLSDKGKAAMEAYRTIDCTLTFYDDFDALLEDEVVNYMLAIPNKDPEFYRVIRLVDSVIERLRNK